MYIHTYIYIYIYIYILYIYADDNSDTRVCIILPSLVITLIIIEMVITILLNIDND